MEGLSLTNTIERIEKTLVNRDADESEGAGSWFKTYISPQGKEREEKEAPDNTIQ